MFDSAISWMATVWLFIIGVGSLWSMAYQKQNPKPCTNVQIHAVITESKSCRKEIALLKHWDCVDQKIREVCR